jgi:hypothetical protein
MDAFLMLILAVLAIVLFLVVVSRTRAGEQGLEEAVHTAPEEGENDPAERLKDTDQMVETINEHRAEKGEPLIDETAAEAAQLEAEEQQVPAQAAHYEDVLQDEVEHFHVPEDAHKPIPEAAEEAARERLRPGGGPSAGA